jgi:hypothetical protein
VAEALGVGALAARFVSQQRVGTRRIPAAVIGIAAHDAPQVPHGVPTGAGRAGVDEVVVGAPEQHLDAVGIDRQRLMPSPVTVPASPNDVCLEIREVEKRIDVVGRDGEQPLVREHGFFEAVLRDERACRCLQSLGDVPVHGVGSPHTGGNSRSRSRAQQKPANATSPPRHRPSRRAQCRGRRAPSAATPPSTLHRHDVRHRETRIHGKVR